MENVVLKKVGRLFIVLFIAVPLLGNGSDNYPFENVLRTLTKLTQGQFAMELTVNSKIDAQVIRNGNIIEQVGIGSFCSDIRFTEDMLIEETRGSEQDVNSGNYSFMYKRGATTFYLADKNLAIINKSIKFENPLLILAGGNRMTSGSRLISRGRSAIWQHIMAINDKTKTEQVTSSVDNEGRLNFKFADSIHGENDLVELVVDPKRNFAIIAWVLKDIHNRIKTRLSGDDFVPISTREGETLWIPKLTTYEEYYYQDNGTTKLYRTQTMITKLQRKDDLTNEDFFIWFAPGTVIHDNIINLKIPDFLSMPEVCFEGILQSANPPSQHEITVKENISPNSSPLSVSKNDNNDLRTNKIATSQEIKSEKKLHNTNTDIWLAVSLGALAMVIVYYMIVSYVRHRQKMY